MTLKTLQYLQLEVMNMVHLLEILVLLHRVMMTMVPLADLLIPTLPYPAEILTLPVMTIVVFPMKIMGHQLIPVSVMNMVLPLILTTLSLEEIRTYPVMITILQPKITGHQMSVMSMVLLLEKHSLVLSLT